MQRLGKNHDGYHGEPIDIRAVLEEVGTAAGLHGWTSEVFHEHAGFKWLALHRSVVKTGISQPATRIYLSAGIHGDEPAGPLAVLKLLRDNFWPAHADVTLLPCLNPIGFTLNQRANARGIDLNRDYRSPESLEIQAHLAWLNRQPQFDFHLCLHEDWESHGFYLYEQNPGGLPSLAEGILNAARQFCPIDLSAFIEGRPAQSGVIRPAIDPENRPLWPEAIYLITGKSRLGYTLESPSDFPLATRVNALAAAVTAAVLAR